MRSGATLKTKPSISVAKPIMLLGVGTASSTAFVIAFCWVGSGTYDAGDWDEAMEEAQTSVSEGTDGAIEELMEQPMLASVLESGLAAFDLSCNGVGDVT